MTYNKIYYLILIVIVGLVSWLVIDFVQNKLQADNILADLPKLTSTGNPSSVFPSPILPQKDWNIMWGAKTEEVKAPLLTTALKPNFILTGTLIEPTSSRALILIPTRNNVPVNEEKVCKVGDKIDEWEIIGIIPDEVKFKNSQSGIVESIRMMKQWTNPITTPQELSKAIKEIGQVNIPGVSQEVLNNLLSGNEPREKVEAYIQAAVATLPPAYIKELIKNYTDIDITDMPDDNKLGDYAKNLFGIFNGQSPVSATIVAENILFTTSVNADNSPISPTISFKSGDRQIYACFANQGTLSGLSKLVHRWTNKSTGELIKLETRLIDSNAPFNFIWVRKPDGWQIGEYEVVLFKTQTLEKVAAGNFSIIP
ncbi:MAG: hypothetical protein V1871_07580 [Planctomycetota bacterium]